MTVKNAKSKKASEARPVYKTPPRNRILVKCKKTLAQTYGERLKGVHPLRFDGAKKFRAVERHGFARPARPAR